MSAFERLRASWNASKRDTIGRHASAVESLRRATGRPVPPAELAQYRPWVHPEGSSIVSLEDFIAPPAAATVLVVTPSPARFRHVVSRGGLNPGQTVHVMYPWQIEGRAGVRVIVLPDAYQLRQWLAVQDAMAAMPCGMFMLLPA